MSLNSNCGHLSKEEIRKIKNDELAWKKVQAYYDWHNISLQTQKLYHKAI